MKNWLLKTVGGTIVVSIIGTALWENVFKPSSGWLLGIIVSLTTFGVKSFQNNIYLEIAKGLHEDTSLRIMLTTYSIFFAALTMIATIYFILKKNKSLNEIKNNRAHLFFNSVIGSNIFITIFITFSIVFFLFDLSRSIYINQAVTYYNQLQTISSPYITDEQVKLANSSFAQIQNSDDYQKVTQTLEQVIIKNKLILPTPPSILGVIRYQAF